MRYNIYSDSYRIKRIVMFYCKVNVNANKFQLSALRF